MSWVYDRIRKWIDKIDYREFESYLCNRVKGQTEVVNVAANIYSYLYAIANNKSTNNNMIIAAPSGSGKTETFRAVRDYFRDYPLIVYQQDVTQITEEGWQGKDTEEILTPFFDEQVDDGIGIVFLDEFDKRIFPSYTSGGINCNRNIQSQLLTLLEGNVVRASKESRYQGRTVNTDNTLFIALGSFDELREKLEKDTHHLGFCDGDRYYDHYNEITRDDIIACGGSYELIGRFPLIYNYHALSDEIVYEIISGFRSKLENRIGYQVEIDDDYMPELMRYANSHYGCRMIESKMIESVMPIYRFLLASDMHPDNYAIRLGGGKCSITTCHAPEDPRQPRPAITQQAMKDRLLDHGFNIPQIVAMYPLIKAGASFDEICIYFTAAMDVDEIDTFASRLATLKSA